MCLFTVGLNVYSNSLHECYCHHKLNHCRNYRGEKTIAQFYNCNILSVLHTQQMLTSQMFKPSLALSHRLASFAGLLRGGSDRYGGKTERNVTYQLNTPLCWRTLNIPHYALHYALKLWQMPRKGPPHQRPLHENQKPAQYNHYTSDV